MSRIYPSCHSFALALIGSLGLFFAFSNVNASDDKDRGPAGMQELGISENFGRWPDGIVEWQYNPTGEAAYYSDDAAFVALLEEAMTEIENVSGVDFQYMGINTGATVLDFSDDIITVGWDDIGGASGIAGPASSCTGSEITAIGYCNYVDGSVRFNNNINAVDFDLGDPEASDEALIGVAMHEILHLLGIGHSDEPISIMYANPYTNLRHLRSDDIQGLRSMYGRSSTPANPETYAVPAQNNPVQVQTSYLANNVQITTQLTTLDDAETGTFLGVTWFENNGDLPISMVVVGPQGYYKSKRVEDNVCGGSGCGWWWSAVSMDTLRTFPGTWTVHLIVDGGLDVTHTIDVQFTPPVINAKPDSQVAFDVSYGAAPLTVNASVTVYGDAEGDNVSATWHIPTAGETEIDFGGSTGQNWQQTTFTQDGQYEIYVEVTDDGSRYGTPGSGAEAGAGFRKLYRKIITVGDISKMAVVPDVNGNGIAEIAVLQPDSGTGANTVYIRDGETDQLISTLNFDSNQAVDMDVVAGPNNGTPDIALLQDIGTNVRVQQRDALTGSLVNSIFYGNAYRPVDMTVMDDLDNSGFDEVVMLGISAANGLRVQARDAVSRTSVSTTFFGSNAYPIDVTTIPNYVLGATPAIAVHTRVRSSNQTRVQLRNAITGAFIRNVFFGDEYEPLQISAIDDLSGDSIADLTQLARRIDNGAVRIQTRSSANGSVVSNAYTGDLVLPIGISTTAGKIGMLVANPTGDAQVTVWNGASGSFVRNVFTATAGSPTQIEVLPDGSDAGVAEEFGVLGNSGGQTRVQIKDSATGAQINNINFP